jgi:ABC-2 type transport system ATP-binding protein
MEAPVLAVERLGKLYGELRAVSELSFTVGPGEIVGLVGPNGAGKTSTLRCLGGVIPASEGTVRVCGHDLKLEPEAAKRELAFLPDEPKLFEYLTVWEHLNFFARLYGVNGWQAKAKELLSELELSEKERALPNELSRGMKQKLSIACGFLHDPKLVILDEPLTGLDPLGIRRMKQSLKSRAAAGAGIVLSSHLLPLVEELCGRIVIIARGQAVAQGTLAEISAQRKGAGAASLEDLFIEITAAAPTAGAAPP